MPITNTDAVLWYNVETFGELGYGVPNPSDDPGSLNPQICDLVYLVGRNLFSIMHTEDVDLRVPPSINTVRKVHRLYVRVGNVLSGRAVPPGTNNMETQHVQPGGEIFRVFPVPYFKVRNHYLRRWATMVMMSLAEMMQHTENRKTIEISTAFAGQIGQYFTRIYSNMAVELFGKTAEEVRAPGFLLTEDDLKSYDPSKWFTSTELVDTVPPLNHVFTEDRLRILGEGINVTDLPELKPYPVNLTFYYEQHGGASASGGASGQSSSSSGAGPTFPPPPQP